MSSQVISAKQQRLTASGTRVASSPSVLIWSLLLGGINVHLDGRQPVILYFDLALACWLTYQFLWKGFSPSFSGWIVRLGIFWILCGMVSALANPHDIARSLMAIKILAAGLLVYAIARETMPSLLSISLWGSVVGVLVLVDYERVRFGTYEGPAGLKDEIGIIMGRSNYVASILVLLIPLAIASVFLHSGKKRWLSAASAMLMMAGLIATMSRGAALAIVLATAVSAPFLFRAGVRMKHVLVVAALLASVIALLPLDLLATDIALIAYRFENQDQTREDLMKATWEAFKDNPVLGVGPGQLTATLVRRVELPDQGVGFMNSHNLILNALAENGIAGGLALLGMVGIVLQRAWKLAVEQPSALTVALWVGLLGAVIHNMVEPSFEGQQFQVIFWIMAGITDNKYINAESAISA